MEDKRNTENMTEEIVEVNKPAKTKRGVPLFIFIICLMLALVVGSLVSFIAGAMIFTGGIGSSDTTSGQIDEKKLNSLKKQIDRYYIGEYSDKDLVEGAYKGYVEGLGDQYSAYMTEKEYKEELESYSGEYSGIGISFNENDSGYFEVYEVYEGSPADKAGIVKGDLILTVDGKRYDNTDDVAKHIRGEKGTEVTVEYMHEGKTRESSIKRDTIHQETVTSEMIDDKTGYIKISSFIETTGDDFEKALDNIESKGAECLVLDLRDNGGGLVDECVQVADRFLDEGVVVYCEDKNGKTETYDAKDGKTGLKTVVLINENSASASEILSYALKDNGFTIIGEKSYGKGVIQVTLPQADGSALELTIMEYLSPNKHKVNKKGVKPDVKVEDDPDTEEDEQLDKAREIIEKF